VTVGLVSGIIFGGKFVDERYDFLFSSLVLVKGGVGDVG